MDLFDSSNLIAGGIEVTGDTIKYGGREYIVGENTKWFMRNKFLQLKYLSRSSTTNEKELLKIVGLKLPLTFCKQLNFYNDDKNPIPVKTDKENELAKYDKSIIVLDNRLNDKIDTIIKRLINEYNLRAPLFCILSDIVKFLAIINKKRKPTASKIKISPQMAELIEKIWQGRSYFTYVVNSDNVPNDMMSLMLYMLETIEKNKQPMGKWIEPTLDIVKYPKIQQSHTISDINLMIDEEKEKLKQKIKNKNGIEVINEYIFTILTVENILIDHVDNIEHYFIQIARNMDKIFDSLKIFFKK
jgi:hypothetical protein